MSRAMDWKGISATYDLFALLNTSFELGNVARGLVVSDRINIVFPNHS